MGEETEEEWCVTINVLVDAKDKTQAYIRVFQELFPVRDEPPKHKLAYAIVGIQKAGMGSN